MAAQPEDVLEDDRQEDGEDQHDERDDDNQEGAEPEGEDGDEEVDVVSWGDAAVAAEDEPEGMRNLREALKREKQARKEAEARVAPKADQVGPEPDMDDYWDKPEQYKTDLLAWSERKRKADEAETHQQASARKHQERWEAQSRDFDAGFADMRVAGKESALAKLEDNFDAEALMFIKKAAGKNGPAFAVALGQSPDKLGELKALWDEGSAAEFIAAAAVMASGVNMQRRKPATAPEQNRSAGGASGGGAQSSQKRLQQLEAEADRTGDRSKIVAFKRQMKEQGK